MIFFILEVAFLPLYLLYIRILHRQGWLTENRFALLLVFYLGTMVFTLSQAISTSLESRVVGFVLLLLCWYPGYSIARRMYRQTFPH